MTGPADYESTAEAKDFSFWSSPSSAGASSCTRGLGSFWSFLDFFAFLVSLGSFSCGTRGLSSMGAASAGYTGSGEEGANFEIKLVGAAAAPSSAEAFSSALVSTSAFFIAASILGAKYCSNPARLPASLILGRICFSKLICCWMSSTDVGPSL